MDQALPVELLPALFALLETESVTLAAKRLHVGQPAMSRTLEKLRDATGDALLVRSGRRLVRTKRGTQLLPEAERLLEHARRVLLPPARFDPRTARGVVTLALGDDMQAVLSGRLIARMREQAPGLDLRLRTALPETVREAQRGIVDLAVLPDVRAQYPQLRFDELVLTRHYTRRFVTVTRRRTRYDLARFVRADHVLMSPQGDEGGYVDDALAALGLKRRVAVTTTSFLAAIQLVRTTDMVATLPEDVVRAVAPELHRQACPVATPELAMCSAWASRFQSDARHRWLRSLVAEVLPA